MKPGPQPEGGNRPVTPRNFHKRMYLYGAATSYIILPFPKRSVGCGPEWNPSHENFLRTPLIST